MKWFRFYNEAYRDPKVQLLRPELFRFWVNFLCVASESEPRGIVASEAHLKLALGVSGAWVKRGLQELEASALLHRTSSGALVPHNWEGRQRESDDAAIRKRGQREKGCVNPENTMSRDTSRDTSRDKNVTPLTGTRALREEGDTDTEERGNPLPLIESLGPEYQPVGFLAEKLGGDVSWCMWVSTMGRLGFPADWIKVAVERCAASGKLKQDYVAGALRGYQRDGGPPKEPQNGRHKPAAQPSRRHVTDEEKAKYRELNESINAELRAKKC